MGMDELKHLPADLVDRASRGNEYAWRISDIPLVIEAARLAGLVNIGGQLQFRIPNDGTCECWWVDVDTTKVAPNSLTWADRVDRSAAFANARFATLLAEQDFVAEGRKGFAQPLSNYEQRGGQVEDVMWFVWYLKGPPEDTT